MAKVLKVAATVVGVAAAIVGGPIGAALAVAATVASVGAAALTKTQLPATTIGGNQSQFTASLDQGLPWLIGRTRTAGCAVHDITYDTSGSHDNQLQTFFGVWSAARCHSLVRTEIDNAEVTFALEPGGSVPDSAQGAYHSWMWQRYQLGATGASPALTATGFGPYPPGWSAAAGLSGMAAFAWTLRFDFDGKIFPGGTVPQKRDTLEGDFAWDPRLDDTWPGGAGPQRRDDEASWGWTENPFLLGLRWARGIYSNGRKVMGIGMALSAIDVDSAIQAANVADAHGWKAGGVVYSTDPKWDVLKKICAAGSGEPIRVGGMLHFLVDAPRVSLDTITTGDLIGKCAAPSGTRMKDRINGVIPTFRSPSNDWQLVPAAKVTVADYVAADGRPRTKAMTWELVQEAGQVATLAAYAIVNAREIDGIVLPCKVRWIGYKPGDAVTVSSSVVAMDSQLVVLRKRNLDPASGAVTFTARTETTAKHAFALAQTTTPPPTPALATVDRTGLLNPGVDAKWSRIADDNGGRPQDNATRNVSRGEWSSTVAYDQGDIVTYNGSSYIAGEAVPVGTPPTNALYWDSFATGGATGPAGPPGGTGPAGQTTYTWIAFADAPDGSLNFVRSIDAGAPGKRAFIGIAPGKASATPSSNPADYGWAPYTGPAGFGLVASASNGGSSIIAGNKVMKGADGHYGWGYSGGYSAQGFTGGAQTTFRGVRAEVGGSNPTFMAGLNTDPTTDNDYTSIDYAFFVRPDAGDGHGTHTIFESGGGVLDCGSWDLQATACQIVYDGKSVSYYLNGLLQRRVAAPANRTLFFDCALVAGNAGVIVDGFGAAGGAGADGAAGIPGPVGANGQPSYVHLAYANSADGTQDFVSGQANPGRTYIGVYTDAVSTGSTDPHAYSWSRLTGQPGANGIAGPVGADGRQSWVHFAYADSVDGSLNFSFQPAGHSFIGVYSDYTQGSSTSPGGYAWSLIKGADGGAGPAGPAGGKGIDGLSALNIRTVGGFTWDGHNLACPTQANDYTSSYAYSANVIPGGVSVSFVRPNLYGNEEGFVGLSSVPGVPSGASSAEFAWRARQESDYRAECWHAGTLLYGEDWNGSYTYTVRYDTGTGVVTWYRNDQPVCTYAAGAGRSYGVIALASRRMSVANLAFTAAGGTGATGNAGPPGDKGATGDTGLTGPPGKDGVSPSPKYGGLNVTGTGMFVYPDAVPLVAGQTVTFALMNFGAAFSSTQAAPTTVSAEIRISFNNWASYSVLGSGSIDLSDGDSIDLNVGGSYTASGSATANFRVVVTRSGNSSGSISYYNGVAQAG